MKKIIKHYPMTDRLIVRGGYIKKKHVSAESLTTGEMISSGTNSPPSEAMTQR